MKFSIIVPVYNSANFLPDCLAGVKNQSFDDWELIFIDDGSTDGSGTILDGYARSDDRIHVFHQENSGQFFAREKGIAMSQGEYILFLDSDDGLMPDCLEKLNEAICESKPDMIMFAYRVSYDDGKEDIERDMIFSEKKEISPNRLRENLISNNTFNALWTKAFRRELFEGDDTDYSALTGTHFGEDKIRLLYPVTVVKKIIYIPCCLYRYNYRQSSTMHRFDSCAIERMLSKEMFSLCYEYMKKWDMDTRFSYASSVSELTTGRTDLWQTYINEFIHNPVLVLLGEGFSSVIIGKRASHNTIIQGVFQFGIIGFPFLIAWFVITIKNLISNISDKKPHFLYILLMGVGIVLPWMALDIIFFDELFLLPVYGALAVAYSSLELENGK